jgi:uncharacterized protein
MTTVDLRSLRLRPGEERRELLDIELDPFLLGGQRYEPVPHTFPAELVVSEISGGTVLTLGLDVLLSGPCMRCLGHAEVPVHVSTREFNDADAEAAEELRSDYVTDERLDVGAWGRDAIALELPEQILCRPECAGLCPVCGKDLNAEPHEHVERELDPRWAVLQQLRDDL